MSTEFQVECVLKERLARVHDFCERITSTTPADRNSNHAAKAGIGGVAVAHRVEWRRETDRVRLFHQQRNGFHSHRVEKRKNGGSWPKRSGRVCGAAAGGGLKEQQRTSDRSGGGKRVSNHRGRSGQSAGTMPGAGAK